MHTDFISLIAASGLFAAIHLLISGTRIRDVLVNALGVRAYLTLFSVATLALVVWMFVSFAAAREVGAVHYWGVTPLTRWIQVFLMLVAAIFIEASVSTGRNPALVLMEKTMNEANVVQGILRVTRHPFLWGWALLSAGHLLVNGDGPSLIAFGAVLITSICGTYSIDAKRRRVFGENWLRFERQTSNIPFAAILDGRQPLRLKEIGWRFALGFGAWFAMLYLHPYFFGVRALP